MIVERGQTNLPSLHTLLRVGTAAILFTLLAIITPPADPPTKLCGFLYLTGHPCPFCGLTRAVFALAKGHIAQAERFNALAPLGFIMLFSLFLPPPLRSGLTEISVSPSLSPDRKRGDFAMTAWIWRIGLLAFALYGVVRFFVTQ